MERLTKLCLKDLYILREYASANYSDFDSDWVLDQIDIAIGRISKLREMAKLENEESNSEVIPDWI